ncbi:hypothetical protein ARMGADRAFT_1048467 [Armillaria gallica]|uniref:Uncharacterized protein n=1 Tax=Armillaria gallica TaxID=47427 RepID=A0A2H3CNA0_ARMGA|nr:hypothetical protein ARMGADRAFT_1048467 [Armillaria gallica]
MNLHHNKANTTVLLTLINTLAFLCLAGFASYLLLHNASLVVNWANSVFAATMFNFSPRTLCFRHTDSGNLPFGWCTIMALGKFDPRCVIDFPPGSTILIPSAILKHSNTTIARACGLEDYWASLGEAEHMEVETRRASRWLMGVQMFSTLKELRK